MAKYNYLNDGELQKLVLLSKAAMEPQQELKKALSRKAKDFDPRTPVSYMVKPINELKEVYDGKMEPLVNYMESLIEKLKPKA